MKTITSVRNTYIQGLKGLSRSKNRAQQRRFLAEGIKNAQEALTHAMVEALLVTDKNCPLAQQAQAQQVEVILVSEPVMSAVCEVVTPQQAAAVVIKEQKKIQHKGIVVLLEDVQDPGNVGTIIRTASAVDAAGVILAGDCADYTSPKVVRSSMGSVFHLPIETVDTAPDAIRNLKAQGYKIVGGDLGGGATWPGGQVICLIIGNESRGVSPETLALCDHRVKIPVYGKAESLNAAVAAGILLYQIKCGN